MPTGRDAPFLAPRASWAPIVDGVLDAVVRHRLAPGTRLAEDELAAIYGVSRTVVRGALQALARDGVVILERNKGARLAKPTPDEAREIFEARAVIEPRIAVRAAGVIRDVDADALRATLALEHDALHAQDLQEVVFQSSQFHRQIAVIAGQRVLGKMLDELLSRSSLVLSLYWRQPGDLCDNDAHHALVDALAGRDGERAARLMREHVEALVSRLDFSSDVDGRTGLSGALGLGATAQGLAKPHAA